MKQGWFCSLKVFSWSSNIPKRQIFNKEIFNILASSDNPDVRYILSRVDYLGKKSIHTLLNDTNQDVVDGMLSNSNLAKHISEEALMKIIDSDNTKLLMTFFFFYAELMLWAWKRKYLRPMVVERASLSGHILVSNRS